MNPKQVTPQDLQAQDTAPVQSIEHELGSTCPTCLSGIEATTLDPQYLDILKR